MVPATGAYQLALFGEQGAVYLAGAAGTVLLQGSGANARPVRPPAGSPAACGPLGARGADTLPLARRRRHRLGSDQSAGANALRFAPVRPRRPSPAPPACAGQPALAKVDGTPLAGSFSNRDR